jgi:hypothetical protein
MKTIIILLLFMPLFTAVISCSNSKSVDDLLNDPEQQDEVLTAIANDSTLLVKLHDKMRSNGEMHMKEGHPMMRSCMAMMDNPEMMSMMMDNMMMRCQEDSVMCTMMCDKMMNSENMRSMMQDRIKDMSMGEDNK